MSTVDSEVHDRVMRVVRETFPSRAQTLTEDSFIRADLGADSMQLIALMIALDAEFDVEFDVDRIPADDVDVRWIAGFVQETLTASQASPG